MNQFSELNLKMKWFCKLQYCALNFGCRNCDTCTPGKMVKYQNSEPGIRFLGTLLGYIGWEIGSLIPGIPGELESGISIIDPAGGSSPEPREQGMNPRLGSLGSLSLGFQVNESQTRNPSRGWIPDSESE